MKTRYEALVAAVERAINDADPIGRKRAECVQAEPTRSLRRCALFGTGSSDELRTPLAQRAGTIRLRERVGAHPVRGKGRAHPSQVN